jgi:hypothetical protein
MKKMFVLLLFVFMVVVGAASSAAPASGDLPFHLSGSGTLNFGGGTQSGSVSGTMIGTGEVSGQFFLTGPIYPCSAGNTDINTLGLQTITAADGSTLTQQLDGVTCQSGPTTYVTTSTYTITGGTRRFSGATGTGTHVRTVDFPNGTSSPGTWTMTQDGTINLTH